MTLPDTTRLGLQRPDTDEPVTRLREAIDANATGLDAATTGDHGTLGSRPQSSPATPGVFNRLYQVTDDPTNPNRIDFDTGAGWITLNPPALPAAFDLHSFTCDEDTDWPADGKRVGSIIVPVPLGIVCYIAAVEHVLDSGADTVFKLRRRQPGGSWADLPGFTAITPTTTENTANPDDVALTAGDRVALHVVTKGTGKGGSVTLRARYASSA